MGLAREYRIEPDVVLQPTSVRASAGRVKGLALPHHAADTGRTQVHATIERATRQEVRIPVAATWGTHCNTRKANGRSYRRLLLLLLPPEPDGGQLKFGKILCQRGDSFVLHPLLLRRRRWRQVHE